MIGRAAKARYRGSNVPSLVKTNPLLVFERLEANATNMLKHIKKITPVPLLLAPSFSITAICCLATFLVALARRLSPAQCHLGRRFRTRESLTFTPSHTLLLLLHPPPTHTLTASSEGLGGKATWILGGKAICSLHHPPIGYCLQIQPTRLK